ncbi:hypothetical protein JK232_02470 [Nissabacter archeti]|uniref:Uncharacterized protein n=1 Tax=Nissabacter archeti TaxID=1917880 RepID=A0ABS5JCR9_9GAMM|nr:hypothetical protein [Nissabacter archeti]MBS0967749.1 hypothetical protein [Nissabacter archeti]
MSEEKEYYIVSVKWTERGDPYITLWGPDDGGYRARLESSGRYSHENVMSALWYYNNGYHTLAVPCPILEEIAVNVKPGWIDGDGGNWIPNNRASWEVILSNAICVPSREARPRYRGAPRSHVRYA